MPLPIYPYPDAPTRNATQVKTSLKLVLRGPEERIVGLHCIGPASDEMMQVSPLYLPCISPVSPLHWALL